MVYDAQSTYSIQNSEQNCLQNQFEMLQLSVFPALPCSFFGYHHSSSDHDITSSALLTTTVVHLLPSRVFSPFLPRCIAANNDATHALNSLNDTIDACAHESPLFSTQSDPTPLIAKDLQQAAFELGFPPKTYWRKQIKPLRISETAAKRKHPSKPGKTQNVPGKAKWIIQQLGSSSPEDLVVTLERCAKSSSSERADWLYVLRYFREQGDKTLFFQVYDFVLQEESFEATVQDYTNLILAYIEVENYAAVEQTIKTMEERDIYPDLVLYTVLLSMYGKRGTLDIVKERFSEMKLWGLKPDSIVYCALVEAYCQLGHPREGELFLEEMEIAKLPYKVEIFTSLIRGYGDLGKVKDAERIFQLLQLKCIYPDRRAFSALMDAHSKNGDVQNAISVFENMISIRMKPTDNSLARLIIVCQNKNLLSQAAGLLQKLESKSLKPGMATLGTWSLWLTKLGLVEEAEMLLDEIERRRSLNRILSRRYNLSCVDS